MKFYFLFLFSTIVLSVPLKANIKLPALVGNNMVLQQKTNVRVWGWANPNEQVELKAEWLEQTISTTTNADSIWEIQLQTPVAGGPYSIVLTGKNRIKLSNILIGEVWVCSGQSNMEKPLGISSGQQPVFNYQEEINNANYPLIHLFHVTRKRIAVVQDDIESKWEVCTPVTIDSTKFSAAAYFFGRSLFQELNVPIGLIDASWGGTRIEPWTPTEGFKMIPKLDTIYQLAEKVDDKIDKHTPTLLYRGMIAPLTNYTIKGFIWYQGESNLMDVNNGLSYTPRMEALVKGWRAAWGNNELPFYYVQIAPYRYFIDRPNRVKSADELPLIWEAQSNALKIPYTGMIVTTDITDDLSDIHPRNKQDIGKRLALQALAKTYQKSNVICDGPIFKSMKLKNGKAILSFQKSESPLMSLNKDSLSYFTIAGNDGKFIPAKAAIIEDKVVVYSPEITAPKAVRFAWNEEARPNLFNEAGLPAVPFRTDH